MVGSVIPFKNSFQGLFGHEPDNIDQLMNQMLSRGGFPSLTEEFNPQVNVIESENHYEITVDVPGVDPKDLNVETRNGDLWITGERKAFKKTKDKLIHQYESRYGKFQRVIRLRDQIDADKIDAEYRNGVLHVMVPKNASSKSNRIEIRN